MLKSVLLTAFFTMVSLLVFAQSTAQRQKHFLTENKLALSGYDPVSYFNGKPAKGKKDLAHVHSGISYQFANAANRDAFKANPDKYEPAYGGWCAYALSTSGDKVEVDPLTYKIVNGRLLLFYNAFFTNTLEKWNAMKSPEAERVKKADQAWQKHLAK